MLTSADCCSDHIVARLVCSSQHHTHGALHSTTQLDATTLARRTRQLTSTSSPPYAALCCLARLRPLLYLSDERIVVRELATLQLGVEQSGLRGDTTGSLEAGIHLERAAATLGTRHSDV